MAHIQNDSATERRVVRGWEGGSRKTGKSRVQLWRDVRNDHFGRSALLLEQVERLGLPSTPLKLTEKRADRWRERWGHEQTEIDALAALNPAELRRLARAAVEPFHDPTLAQRNHALAERWRPAAQGRLDSHPDAIPAKRRIDDAHKELEEATASFNEATASFIKKVEDAVNSLPKIIRERSFSPRKPYLNGSVAPDPLFTTSDDYLEATQKLLSAKRQYDEP